ncbi:MAG: M3 family oligoendopeptidase [Lachnospiraceae bacterium]|nr:M3 family oligoendopeptidase [Lachnospiraceae bacterium]
MKFSEMKYERPNKAQLIERMKDCIARFRDAASFEEAKAVFLEWDENERHVHTLRTLADIRNSIDTRDAFYEAEEKWWNETGPELQEFGQLWQKALVDSPFRKELEKEFGKIIFTNAEIALKAFSPEIISEMQQENDLVTAYEKLIASAQIPFEGKTYTISQMAPFRNDADDTRRLAAWKATGQWFKEHQEELDRLYDELVHLRDAMGRKLGYDGYTELGYYRMSRNCYDKTDVEKFRKAVVEYLVPVAEKIRRAQAERTGKAWPLSYSDMALEFKSGNPKPAGGVKEIVEAGKRFYDALSPETSDFFNGMIENGMMDLESKEGKRAGGYMTEIFDYKTSFIFANFNGTQHDVEVVTHEAGHAFAGYMNYDRVPLSTTLPTMEACEVHSMSMEFFGWKSAEDFFGADTKKFLYSHLTGSILFIPYGTLVDHFQHVMYEKPDLSPKERHAEWKRLQQIYMPWVNLDGDIPFYADGEAWQQQLHIYVHPFYYIDYCLAQTVALSFWAMIQEDENKAWEKYMAYTRLGGSLTFTELLEKAGLQTPFGGEMLKQVCERATAWLDDYDLEGVL